MSGDGTTDGDDDATKEIDADLIMKTNVNDYNKTHDFVETDDQGANCMGIEAKPTASIN